MVWNVVLRYPAPLSDKVFVERLSRFHQLDGVEWTDTAAKAKLYVGSAINAWSAMEFLEINTEWRAKKSLE